MFMAGSNSHIAGAANTWLGESSKRATSNQVNGVSSTSNLNRIGAVKLEIGDTATTWQGANMADEVAKCQRYYETSYNDGVAPGTVTSTGAEREFYNAVASANHTGAGKATFKATKAKTPTVTAYSPNTGTSGQIYDAPNATDVAASISQIGEQGFWWSGAQGSAQTTLNMQMQWVADAELT
jgi:hypothetical protein